MALTSLQGGGRGISFDDYFKQALNFDISKLEAIIRGQDHSMPIVAAMAAYEVKKPMVTAATGQQAQQQLQQAQPTVRQEMEQEMDKSGMIPDMAMLQQQRMGPQPPVLPEQAGVGALPAPNMEGMSMAHGGIIAFDDGGDVPGYAAGDLMSAMPPPKKDRGYSRSITDKLNKLAEEEGYQRELFQPIDPEKEIAKLQQQLASLPPDSPQRGLIQSRIDALAKMPPKAAATKELKFKPYPTDVKKPTAVDPTAGQAVTDANASPGFIPPEKLPVSKPPTTFAPTTTRGAAPGAPAAPTTPAARKVGVEDILEAQQAISSQGDAEVRGLLNKYGKDTTAGIEALKKEREVGKPTGEAYSAYEKALQKEETEAKGKEERNLQMALVNAGLGMMAGTSQYALENIGKGAMVGTKQYMDGIDKLEAAAKKRQEAMAMIENARRAEARGDWEKKNEFAVKAFELDRGVQKANIDAISSLTGKNKEISAQLLNRAQQDEAARERTLIETQSAERRTQQMVGAEMAKVDAMKNQNLFFKQQQSINMAADNAENALKNYAAANKLNLLQMQQQDPNAYNKLREYFRREAFAAAGLEYKPTAYSEPSLSPEDKALINKYK